MASSAKYIGLKTGIFAETEHNKTEKHSKLNNHQQCMYQIKLKESQLVRYCSASIQTYNCAIVIMPRSHTAPTEWNTISLGPFYGAIAVPSVTRCRCRCCGHRCAGGMRVAACDSSDTW